MGMRRREAAAVCTVRSAVTMRMVRGMSRELSAGARAPLSGGIDGVFPDLARLGLARLSGSRRRPADRGWLCGSKPYGRVPFAAPEDERDEEGGGAAGGVGGGAVGAGLPSNP